MIAAPARKRNAPDRPRGLPGARTNAGGEWRRGLGAPARLRLARRQRVPAAGLDHPLGDGEPDQRERHVVSIVPAGQRLDFDEAETKQLDTVEQTRPDGPTRQWRDMA
jgi:hypothetical protein